VNRLSFVAHQVEVLAVNELAPIRAALESFLEGTHVTARIGEPELLPLLCGLAYAAADLAAGHRPRAVVRLCALPDPWEVGLERAGRDVLVSVFLGGTTPEVALHERRLDGDAFCARLIAAIDAFGRAGARRTREGLMGEQPGLESARRDLEAALPFAADFACPETAAVAIDPTGAIPIVISADVSLRTPNAIGAQGGVLRADLFSLLFRGRVRVVVGEHARELPDVFVFLFAEQLASMTLDAVEAWTRGRALHRRTSVGGAICGVRVNPKGAASLTLGIPARLGDERAQTWTFPAVDVVALVQGVVAFGRALARSLVRRDRSQAYNLRLVSFRARLRELSERLRDTTRNDSIINAAPESYRAFAAALRSSRPAEGGLGRTRLRFNPRWLAMVPSIDLRSTFLCGEVIVVGAAREISCLERIAGQVVWKRPVARGLSVVSPVGLARLEADGHLTLHDLSTGEALWTVGLTPRVGATASGAVVNAPGLPRLLIVSEGSRNLCAVDLQAGEVRWRHAARRGGVFLVRRAGKLVVVANGEPALTALDVLTGEVVWRFCDPLRFASHVAVGSDALLAVSGDGAFLGRGGTRLHELDPWSGAARWSADLPAHVAPVGPPLLGSETAIVVTHGRRGTGLVGFDRRSGTIRFDRVGCLSPASAMVVDDTVILNSEGGELVAVDANDGTTRYRHVLSSSEGDKPRRLEPVLRSGALFVPQSEIHVVRPRDGTVLGRVPTDLIPDLLRVDERCDVYVVEESGHLAAFGAAPRLTLVQ